MRQLLHFWTYHIPATSEASDVLPALRPQSLATLTTLDRGCLGIFATIGQEVLGVSSDPDAGSSACRFTSFDDRAVNNARAHANGSSPPLGQAPPENTGGPLDAHCPRGSRQRGRNGGVEAARVGGDGSSGSRQASGRERMGPIRR
jgi:hypothetical protein